MAAPKKALTDTARWKIYVAYCAYVDETGTLPGARVFWSKILPGKGTIISEWTFYSHWRALIRDGLIQRDELTGAVKVVNCKIKTPLVQPD